MRRITVASFAVAPTLLVAQQPSRFTLAPASASLAEEFSNLVWARELKDGRVIITDSRDGRIVVADLRAGSVQQIGRKGQGPNEYPRAQPVWSVGGDSSVMMGSPERWLMFDGPRIVATLAPDAPGVSVIRGIARER